MRVNYKRVAVIFMVSIVLTSIALGGKSVIQVPSSYMSMFYTVVSVVFSVCMGVACSLNIGRVKNDEIYIVIKNSSLMVRDTSICLFVCVTLFWILATAADCYWMTSFFYSFSLVSLLYFVLNFKTIQDLNYEIEDRSRNI